MTGWTEPGAIAILTPAEEILFVPHRNERRETFNGKRVAPEDPNAAAMAGFDTVLGVEKFEASLRKAMDGYENLYAVADSANTAKLKSLVPFRDVLNGAQMVAALRMKKSPGSPTHELHSGVVRDLVILKDRAFCST